MSFKVYPVTKTELFCDDYIVKINGSFNTSLLALLPRKEREDRLKIKKLQNAKKTKQLHTKKNIMKNSKK